jgi:molecular chaperone GrpE
MRSDDSEKHNMSATGEHRDDQGEEIEVEVKKTSRESQSPESTGAETGSEGEIEADEPSAEEKLAEIEDRYLRLAAEFDNYKKRTAKQFSMFADEARLAVLSELLTVQDNFERALEVDDGKASLADFKKGVELIFSQIDDLLKKNGVEAYDSVGEKFDPNLHEALMTVDSNDHEPDTVVQELSKGYKINGRVLRHARVAVARQAESDL